MDAPAAHPDRSRRLRVAVDATAVLGQRTGVGRFVSETTAFLATRPDIDLCLFAVSWRGRDRLGEFAPPGVRVVRRPMAARPLRMAWQRLDRPRIESFTGPVDVVHGPNFVVPPTRHAVRVVTVHDLTPWRFAELANQDTRVYPRLVARAVADAAWVHTPSEYVRTEVVERLGVDPDRVVTVHNGVTPLEAAGPATDAEAGHRLVGSDRYVLALGAVEPRKDLPLLVDAFDRVAGPRPDVRLVIAGPDGWGTESLAEALGRATRPGQVVRLGYVGEAERAALLRGATVLAYPSRYEGFGLPPLEAMAAGVPVVASDAGALPEVLGDAALFVHTPSGADDRERAAGELADALGVLLDDDAQRAESIRRGRARVVRYDWSATADGVADLYHRAVNAAR